MIFLMNKGENVSFKTYPALVEHNFEILFPQKTD